ncbi:hypothetical protein SUGI_1421340 [Cryptomeria japonica]|uniref:Uncharacterized protein n=1 Tax=Cryptomeria japonica TaxID=3369 RepID=A0AAD3RNV5_CRYJA|nr:uncharacterized protein LOC131870089 isoform X1 [Cryptomeria japonica]XP_059071782.1 uncharacterized protein LOC131870098 isoform X1 [Cryptomeria japonica]GLJ58140.1 hypothetical protein SUGI_1421270 [Cryptomeria japonica]GLJ58147.1 hypothetical protein SUGI_1421340 [Cryptomeria japonica]
MAFKIEYEWFFAVMMGMAIIMFAGTGMATAEDTEGSKSLLSMTQATTQAPFHVHSARITERKSRPSDSVETVLAEMPITEQAALRDAIFFLFFLLFLTSLAILCLFSASKL